MSLPPEHGHAFSKIALLQLGLHQGSATSYLHPRILTKGLLSVDDYQIIIALGEYEWETSYSAILLISYSWHLLIRIPLIMD